MAEALRFHAGLPSYYACAGDMPAEDAAVMEFSLLRLNGKGSRKAESVKAFVLSQKSG